MPLTSAFPTFLAAAIVLSSMLWAKAKGVVPGTKLATVKPKPPFTAPPTKPRLVMSNLLMIFLPLQPLRPLL
jgi:hypothetical protein